MFSELYEGRIEENSNGGKPPMKFIGRIEKYWRQSWEVREEWDMQRVSTRT